MGARCRGCPIVAHSRQVCRLGALDNVNSHLWQRLKDIFDADPQRSVRDLPYLPAGPKPRQPVFAFKRQRAASQR